MGHAVRGAQVARFAQQGGPLGERGEHFAVGGGVEQAHVGAFVGDAGGGRVAVHVAGAGVRVLHVVHRILVGMRGQQVQVDVHRGVVVGAGQRIAGGVHADGVGQVVDGDDVAGALRHAHGLAVLHDVDELADEDLHVLARLVTERLAHGHHAADVAVVVGAEHVNRHVGRVGLAVALVAVVGDVGGEVRVVAVGLDDHAVLVVTVLGGFEPGGAVLFEDVAAGAQIGDGLVHFAVGIQAVLVEPHVEIDAEVLHGTLDFVEHHRHGALAELLALFGIAFAERVAVLVGAAVDARQAQHVHAVRVGFVDDTLGDFVDVRALVAVDRGFLAVGRGDERLGEAVDLLAVVVEVVFAHHLGAVGLEHAGHGIADGSPTGAADVNRTGGVGGDELEIQGLAAQMVVAAVFVDLVEMLVGVGHGTGGEYGVHHGGGRGGVKRDVDEAGACHLDLGNAVGFSERGGERLGQIARLHAGLLGQLHGNVGGPVAMRTVLRAHHGELVDGRNQLVGQRAGLAGGDEVVGNAGNQFT